MNQTTHVLKRQDQPKHRIRTLPCGLEESLARTVGLLNRQQSLRDSGGNFMERAQIQADLHEVRAQMAKQQAFGSTGMSARSEDRRSDLGALYR